jgi:diaminopimelate decarboxylase
MMPGEARTAFAEYKGSPHLNMSGIHLHIGSQNPSAAAYAEALEILFVNLHEIFGESGIKVSHVNLGGGFPVNYLSDHSLDEAFADEQRDMFQADFDPADAVANAWSVVKRAADNANAAALLDDLTLLLEPGRSIIADAGILLTSVRNLKSRPVGKQSSPSYHGGESAALGGRVGPPAGDTDTWLLTDAGFNLLLSTVTYHWYYHLISAQRAGEDADFPYKLAGPLCDGGDVYFDVEGERRLPDHRLLPADVKLGEVLALLNCGAYSLSQASQYNGRFLPPVVLIKEGGTPELIRERDRFEDLISRDIY